MSKLLIADLTNEKLRRALGGAVFSLPTLNQGSDLYLGLRFSEEIYGTHVVAHPIVREIRVAVGELDLRPEAGAYSLKVGTGTASVGDNVTASIAFDATATDIQTALNALSTVSTAVVTEDDSSFLVTGVADDIAVYNNTLRPITFVRVSAYEVDGETTQAIRLQRAPLAFADNYTQKVPTAPSISRVQAGGSSGDIEWNEVQKLTVPADFQGSYQIRSSDSIQRTSLLGPADTVETIAAAMNPRTSGDDTLIGVADDVDGLFLVTQHPTESAALIEFTGSMEGAAKDLLVVSVFDAPEGDYWVTVPLDTAAMAEAMRTVDKIKVPLEIYVDVEDPDDDSIVRTLPVFRGDVTILEKVTYDDLGTAANIDYLNPPSPKSYRPFNASQVITGQRHYSTDAGNGAATTFTIAHNLASEEIDVRVRENTSGGALLIHGTDYTVAITDDNNLDVTVIGSYASPVPASNALIITVADLAAEATFAEDLTVEIDQVNGLQTILDTLADRLTALEVKVPDGSNPPTSVSNGEALVIPLNPIFTVYPSIDTFTAPNSGRLIDLNVTDAQTGRLYPAVHDAAAEALTVPLLTPSVTYQGRVFQYSGAATAVLNLPGGDRLKPGEYAACDGRRWYRVEKYAAAESSWYPAALSRDLFSPIEINANQLRLRRTLTLEMGLESLLIYDRHPGRERLTQLNAVLAIEVGYRAADSTPGTPGSNLSAVTWTETPLVSQPIVITGTPRIDRIGVEIIRAASGITMNKLLYGAKSAGTAPSGADFLLRARLRNVDTENAPTDARGLIALSGLTRTEGDEDVTNLGRCVIA